MEEISSFISNGNISLTHKEVVPYGMYEPPTKKSRSITVYIIHVSDNGNLASKIAITQAEGSVDYLTTYLEEEFSETSK